MSHVDFMVYGSGRVFYLMMRHYSPLSRFCCDCRRSVSFVRIVGQQKYIIQMDLKILKNIISYFL